MKVVITYPSETKIKVLLTFQEVKNVTKSQLCLSEIYLGPGRRNSQILKKNVDE